jgi:hypothetical protein
MGNELDWREEHAKQPHKNRPFEEFAPAYLTGSEAVKKYPGKRFEEIEDAVALDYERNKAGSALPWDQARPAVRAAWDRIGGVIAPRDVDRGTRSGI